MIEERAAEKQFTSLGLVMHSQGGGLVICGGKDREKILTVNKVELGESEEWQLFSTLISRYIRWQVFSSFFFSLARVRQPFCILIGAISDSDLLQT